MIFSVTEQRVHCLKVSSNWGDTVCNHIQDIFIECLGTARLILFLALFYTIKQVSVIKMQLGTTLLQCMTHHHLTFTLQPY